MTDDQLRLLLHSLRDSRRRVIEWMDEQAKSPHPFMTRMLTRELEILDRLEARLMTYALSSPEAQAHIDRITEARRSRGLRE